MTGGALTAAGGAFTFTGTNVDLDPTGTYALDMDASQTATISVADNLANAFLIQQGSDAYLDITTTDSSEKVEIGNATTNPGYEFLGSGLVDMANGTADIPAGASLSLGGVACDANVTAANLSSLVDGSNADSLHTHATTPSSQVQISGLTTTGLADGDFGYASSADTMTKTDNATLAKSRLIGCNEGTAGSMTVSGTIENAKFTTDGGSPAVGSPVYLAAAADDTSTGAGKLTATAPTSGILAEVGICLNNANYAGSKTAEVLLQVKTPVTL